MIILITELKSYYCECLPYITNQTRNHKDTAPSILEEIASEISAQLEWENEWNSQGLASRLSEQVYPYQLCRILVMIKHCIKLSCIPCKGIVSLNLILQPSN